METERVWVLLCSRTGANHQALALAEELALPFEAKPLRHNFLRRLAPWLGPSRLTVDSASRSLIHPPWPGLVIAVSRANVPLARWIRRASGGRTKIVFLGNPRVDPRHLDLVVTTSDYLQPRGANVLVMPLPVVSPTGTDQPRPDWIADLPQPRLLFLIGGPLKHYDLTPAAIAEAVAFLASRANKDRGSLIVSGSPRTPDELIAAAETALAAARNGRMVTARTGGLAPIIASADEIFVTGDSMAMITEAILSGAPVGIVPLALTSSGRHKLGNQPAADGSRSRRRDLRRFWTGLWKSGLAGTLDEPKRGAKQIPSKQAADAVRRLLDPAAPKPHERAE